MRISSSRTFSRESTTAATATAGVMNYNITKNKDMTSSSSDDISATMKDNGVIQEYGEQSPTTSLVASFENEGSNSKLLHQGLPGAEVKLISEENNKTKNITRITSNSQSIHNSSNHTSSLNFEQQQQQQMPIYQVTNLHYVNK